MDRLNIQSQNLVNENIEKIAKLFPNCITEGKNKYGQIVKLIDFNLLKQELSEEIVEGNDERYTLNWAGKKQSILTANSPIYATLRPCKEESVDFDNTKNIYIEGDNLDALKLLRETYLGKIKMIYIDPPYNTGNDFVYEDDFATSADVYLHASKCYDDQGNRMFQNNNCNGRFHSDWLSMMYSRLKISRDLLSDDGAIFISIDDNEVDNLKKIANEIFGEKNQVACITIKGNPRGRQSSSYFAQVHDYLLVYRKTEDLELIGFDISEEDKAKRFNKIDSDGELYEEWELRKRGADSRRENSPNLWFPIYYNVSTNEISLDKLDGFGVEIIPKLSDGSDGRWRWSKTKVISNKEKLYVRKNNNGIYNIYEKKLVDEKSKQLAPTIWDYSDINTELGTKLVKSLFNNRNYFDFPKPVGLIQRILQLFDDKEMLVLDFFSGSSTTAHAVLEENAIDSGNRRFIMIQIPEKCNEKSDAFTDGYFTIPEIAKERIRRAGNKIKQENKQLKLDTGFRVFKLDSSNMKDIYYRPTELNQASLLDYVSNIKEDRTPEDLLFQVMLDLGFMLSSDIKSIDISGKKIFSVNNGELVCCFDKDLTDDLVTEIAKMQPLYAVFRDASMSSDSVAINFDQIFETYSPNTTRKVL